MCVREEGEGEREGEREEEEEVEEEEEEEEEEGEEEDRPVVRSVRVRLCTLTFHGYARLRTLTPQHSARLCTLGDTEVDLLYSHA